MQAKFRLSSSQFFLTYPKCPLDPVNALKQLTSKLHKKSLEVRKYVIAQEDHADGTKHLHCYIAVSSKLNVKNPRLFDLKNRDGDDVEDYHGNYQSCRSARAVINYCKKDGRYIQSKDMDITVEQAISKENKKTTIMEVIDGSRPVSDLVTLFPNLNTLTNYTKLKANVAALLQDLRPTGEKSQVCGKWIVGKPGVGKSHFARFGIKPDTPYYVKAQTRWWDGYEGQEVVILDDLSPPGLKSALSLEELAYFLKRWTDRYTDLAGEVKGASLQLKFRLFVVTSNYTIDEIFGKLDDYELLAALKRRFVIIPIISRDDFGPCEKPDQYEDSNTQRDIEKRIYQQESSPLDACEVPETDPSFPSP